MANPDANEAQTTPYELKTNEELEAIFDLAITLPPGINPAAIRPSNGDPPSVYFRGPRELLEAANRNGELLALIARGQAEAGTV